MSLSVTAVLEAAVEAGPDAALLSHAGTELNARQVDQRSRRVACAALLGGLRPGARVRGGHGDHTDRVCALLGALRIGLVVVEPHRVECPILSAPSPAPSRVESAWESLLLPAEQDVWSETLALERPSGRLTTHGELVIAALDGSVDPPRAGEPARADDTLVDAVVAAIVQRRVLTL